MPNIACVVNQLHWNVHVLWTVSYLDSYPSTRHIRCHRVNMLLTKWQTKWMVWLKFNCFGICVVWFRFSQASNISILPRECCGPSAIHELAVSSRPCIKNTGTLVVFASDGKSFPIRCICTIYPSEVTTLCAVAG